MSGESIKAAYQAAVAVFPRYAKWVETSREHGIDPAADVARVQARIDLAEAVTMAGVESESRIVLAWDDVARLMIELSEEKHRS